MSWSYDVLTNLRGLPLRLYSEIWRQTLRPYQNYPEEHARARPSKRGGIPCIAGRAARRAADADNSRRLSDGAGDPASAALRSAEAIGRGERATERGAYSAGRRVARRVDGGHVHDATTPFPSIVL